MILSPSSEEQINSRSTILTSYEDYDHDYHHQTAKWNLVLSCFITIFVCAWIAIHPNAITVAKPPGPNWFHRIYTFWTLLYERLVLVFIFIIFPEFILAWALVQRHMANLMGWTQTHGFLAVMGGFHYYKGANLDEPCHAVQPGDLLDLVGAAKITLPLLEEIQDKSKSGGSGGLAIRALALLQVFWFVTQSITKATTMTQSSQESEQTRVTKLELLTTAYIMMAVCIRMVWWNKPLNVKQSIRVPLSLEPKPGSSRRQNSTMVYGPPPPSSSTYIRKYHYRYVQAVDDLLCSFSSNCAHFPKGRTVPRFYTGGRQSNIPRSSNYFFILLLPSIVFAAINCVAWSYDNNDTLSSIEIELWQLSSFAGVAFWLISIQNLLILMIVDWLEWAELDSFASNALCAWMMSLWALFYVLLRVTSFILAIRELNTDANLVLDTVYWTYFIPHV